MPFRWSPTDTHPAYEFEVEVVQHDEETAAAVGHPDGMVAKRAWYLGREISDADKVLQSVHAEHRMKNVCMAIITENLPAWTKRPVLVDGEPMIDFASGTVAMEVRPLFAPTWEWGDADGVIAVRWPPHVAGDDDAEKGRKAAEDAIAARFGDRVVFL